MDRPSANFGHQSGGFGGALSVVSLRRNRARLVVLAAALVFVCRLTVSLALIPPWQQPDEPAQVAVLEVYRNRLLSLDLPDPGRESEILRSMADHEWWRHYGSPITVPLPPRFWMTGATGETLGVDPTSPAHTGYYSIVTAMLFLAPGMSVVTDMYVMRVFSAVLALVTLWVAWRGVGAVFGEAAGATVAMLLAVHPQFAVVATTASADALVNLAGACMWWQAMRVVRRENVIWSAVAVWLIAILGAAADRMAVPLLVSAWVVSVFAILQTGFRRSTVALTVVAVTLLGAVLWLVEALWGTFSFVAWSQLMPVARARTWEFLAEFSSFLFQSWWFSLGWVRYGPPSWWVAVALVPAAVAIVGLMRRLRSDDNRMRALISVTLAMVAVQVASEYWAYFRFAYSPQGRHIFPMLIPALVLIWLGVEAWAPIQYRRHAAVGLVSVFAVLDITAWVLVGIPAYAG